MIDTLATFADQVTNVARRSVSKESSAVRHAFPARRAYGATSPTT